MRVAFVIVAVWLLALALPAISAIVMLLAFILITFTNAWYVWRGLRHKEHHSLIPVIGGLCGVLALWAASRSDKLSMLNLPSGAWIFAPLALDIGTPVLVISVPFAIARSLNVSRPGLR